jgi:NAD(P)-dependent dehydrogenase (short-subunit alcohol dehydrogenase family)
MTGGGADDAAGADAPVMLVTGASSGIGRGTAARLAARGWRVFASMRRPDSEKGDELRAEARRHGWRLETVALDVTDDASVAQAVAAVLGATGGRIDVLLNNAGYYAFGPLEETTPDELRAQFETNVVGMHRVARAVLPAMRARKSGRLIFLGSISGRVALPIVGPYHASKWALEGLVESWRYELAPLGIWVVLLEPGPFRTALHDNEVLAAGAGAAGSPYRPLIDAYLRQSAGLRRGDLPPLLDTIERAATVDRPALRWPTGPTAFSAAYLRRLVPDRLYELMLRIAFRTKG